MLCHAVWTAGPDGAQRLAPARPSCLASLVPWGLCLSPGEPCCRGLVGLHPPVHACPPCLSACPPRLQVDRIGKDEPLSEEKLCPLLAMYRARDFDDAVQKADRLVMLFGAGHTSVLYTSPLNRVRIERFTRAIKTVRVLVNTPSSQVRCCGAVGCSVCRGVGQGEWCGVAHAGGRVGEGARPWCMGAAAAAAGGAGGGAAGCLGARARLLCQGCPSPLHHHHRTHAHTPIIPPHPPTPLPRVQGAIGDLYNFHLDPSLTLGCGSWGSTSVSTSECGHASGTAKHAARPRHTAQSSCCCCCCAPCTTPSQTAARQPPGASVMPPSRLQPDANAPTAAWPPACTPQPPQTWAPATCSTSRAASSGARTCCGSASRPRSTSRCALAGEGGREGPCGGRTLSQAGSLWSSGCCGWRRCVVSRAGAGRDAGVGEAVRARSRTGGAAAHTAQGLMADMPALPLPPCAGRLPGAGVARAQGQAPRLHCHG